MNDLSDITLPGDDFVYVPGIHALIPTIMLVREVLRENRECTGVIDDLFTEYDGRAKLQAVLDFHKHGPTSEIVEACAENVMHDLVVCLAATGFSTEIEEMAFNAFDVLLETIHERCRAANITMPGYTPAGEPD